MQLHTSLVGLYPTSTDAGSPLLLLAAFKFKIFDEYHPSNTSRAPNLLLNIFPFTDTVARGESGELSKDGRRPSIQKGAKSSKLQ